MSKAKAAEAQAKDPVLGENTVVIAGVEHKLRRLGIVDVFAVARIMGRGVATLTGLGNDPTPAQVVQVLISSLAANEDEVLDLIASVIGVTRDDLNDPERYPLDSTLAIVEALAEHQDLTSFLASVGKTMQKLPNTKTRTR